jgi:uncharacterized protein (DUF697 family)
MTARVLCLPGPNRTGIDGEERMATRFDRDLHGVTATAARTLAKYLLEKGIDGAGPLSSAEELAADWLDKSIESSNDERVEALIARETTKNFTTGFLTGLGGALTLPVAVPSALIASWLLQARLAGAIARIYGHDLRSSRTRTTILLSLAGDVARDAMEGLGLRIGTRLTQRAVDQIPGRALVEINKRIGLRLVAKAGERSVSNFSRFVPLVGGVVGGAMDALVCRTVGKTAQTLFRRPDGVVIEGEVEPGP